MKKIIIGLIIGYILGIITMPIYNAFHKKVLSERVIYTITIDNEFINLREDIDLTREPIRKVYKGEKYQVVEYYEGNAYNWYRVIYDEDKTGWLASGKKKSWVIVENQ